MYTLSLKHLINELIQYRQENSYKVGVSVDTLPKFNVHKICTCLLFTKYKKVKNIKGVVTLFFEVNFKCGSLKNYCMQ